MIRRWSWTVQNPGTPAETRTKLLTGSYAWDGASRLREVTTSGGTTQYTYEPEGLRRSRKFIGAPLPDGTVATEETAYLWQHAGSLYAEKVETGTPLAYEDAGPGAAYAGNARVIRDALGSPAALIEGTTTTHRWRFGAWGDYREGSIYDGAPATGQSLGFTGHAWDGSSGLIYARQRWYDPSIGRFLSTDPAGTKLGFPATTNPYLYAAGNPTGYVDPNGASPVLAGIAAAMVLDATVNCALALDATGDWGACGSAAKGTFLPSFAAGAVATGVQFGLSKTPVVGPAFSGALSLSKLLVRTGSRRSPARRPARRTRGSRGMIRWPVPSLAPRGERAGRSSSKAWWPERELSGRGRGRRWRGRGRERSQGRTLVHSRRTKLPRSTRPVTPSTCTRCRRGGGSHAQQASPREWR